MSKVLYPKAMAVTIKKAVESPLHIVYSDLDGSNSIVRHYSSSLAAKVAAWYNCRFIGFSKAAVLYTSDEYIDEGVGVAKAALTTNKK